LNLQPPVLETGALPIELRPWVAEANGTAASEWQHPGVQRRLLGLLFAVLAVGLGLIAFFSALEGGGAWVIALAAAALAFWLGDLARRALVRRRS
jgi:predicted lipid-binding transport protein (Tim44 family)